MWKFWLSLKIRVKLLTAFASILLLAVLSIISSVTSINKITNYKAINEEVDVLKLHLYTLDLATKNFMYEDFKSESFLKNHQSPSIKLFEESNNLVKSIVAEINNSTVVPHSETDKLSHSLILTIENLKSDFLNLVDLLGKRGFKDNGLEGSLREAIHQVENSSYNFNKASMLMLRRHEKDFFLRKDLKYQREFNAQFDQFYEELKNTVGSELTIALQNYKERFNNVVEIEKQIGLKEDQGIRGRIKANIAFARPQLESFRTQIITQNEAQIANTKFILWIIFSLQILLGVIMALFYANWLTKSIKEIRDAVFKLASGGFPDKFITRTTEEVGQTKMAFNHFVDRLKSATGFAEQLGNGQLKAQYDMKYADDVLAQSLINAQKKLLEADEHQSKINWTNEGVARFNEILKNETEEIEALSNQILRVMINYLNANQGALYIYKKKEKHLEQIALYAYEKKKYQAHHKIGLGDGIVGQCFLEGSTIYLKDVPKDFVKITSGLGEATPRNVIITPLKIRSEVMGVIELASFQLFQHYQIEFIERMAESIATILSNRQNAHETKFLLEEFRQRENSLIRKEEELRKNSDDLSFVQQEMERQRSTLQQEIVRLKRRASVPQD